MDLMALPFPQIDPVAFGIGPVQVRWYGLAYLAGFVLGWLYMRRLLAAPEIWRGARSPMKPAQADDFLLWAALGTVIGGRAGYVLLYEPDVFLADPGRIFAVWQGGMSFHGGLIGVTLAIYGFSRFYRVPLLSVGDLASAAVPIGLFFGRLANFINGEVYGRLTSVPWAVEFPAYVLSPGDEQGPRHPSQFYEAFLEGVVLFFVLRYLIYRRDALKQPGLISGLFLSGYSIARIFVELFFRQPAQDHFLTTSFSTPGMVYSLPMLAAGVALIAYSARKQSVSAA